MNFISHKKNNIDDDDDDDLVNPEDFDMDMEEVNLQEFEDVLAKSVANL